MQSVIGALRVNLGLDSAQFEKGLGRAHKRLGEMRRQFAGVAGLAAAAASGLGVLTAATARSANEITGFSQVANATPAELQRWSAATKTVGIEQDKLADILKDVNDRVGDYMATGAGPMVDFFENIAPKVGVTAEMFRKLSGPEALQLYVSSLEKAGASQQDMTFYLEAMASDATLLLPLLRNGGAEMERLAGNADSLGAVMDNQTVAALNRAHLALGDVGLAMQGVGNRIAGSLAPGLTTLATAFADSMREGGRLRTVTDLLISNLDRLATYVATAVGLLGVRYVSALVAARAMLIAVNLQTLGLIGSLKLLRGAIARTGFGLLVIAAAELGMWFSRLVTSAGGFGNALSLLGDIGREVWGRIGDGGRGLYLILQGVAKGIAAAFVHGFAWIGKHWDKVVNGMREPFNGLMESIGLDARMGASAIGAELSGVADAWEKTAVSKIEEGGALFKAAATAPLESLAALKAIMAAAGDETLGGAAAADALSDALAGGGGVEGAGGKAAKGAEKLSKAAEAAKKRLDDLRQSAEAWVDRTATPLESYRKQMAELAAIQADPALRKEFPNFDETAARAARELNVELADSLPLVGGLTDALSEGLVNGFEGTVDRIKGLFKQMLAEMIATAAKNRIVMSLGLSGGGAGAGAMGGALGGALGGLGATLGGLGSTFMANMTGIFAADAAGFAATMAGATGSLTGFAAAAGALALPIAGAIAAFDFFRTKTKTLDQGIRVTADGMALAVEQWEKVRKSRFWGLSTSRSTDYAAAGRAVADPVMRAFGEISDNVTGMAESLGIGARAFRSFSHEISLSTKGMDEAEAAQALQEALAGMGEAMAAHVLEARLAIRTGETATEALARLSEAIAATRDAADLLGHAMLPASIEGAKLASILVEAAGGLDAFGSAAQAYLSGFYSEAEQAAIATRRVADQMAALGVAMPGSRAQFRAMVEAIDTTTAAGAQLYGEMLGMAAALDQVLPAVASFTAEIAEMVGVITSEIDAMIGERSEAMRANAAAASDWYRAAQTLRGFVADLAGTAGALVSADRARAFTAARFEALLARGLAGDAEAVSDITGAARAFLTSSAASARTAAEQARAEAKVLGDLQLLAGASDIEGARHDAVAGLLGEQVGVLEQVKDYLASGGVLDPAHIAGLERQLGELESAISAAEMINYAFLKERLAVSVELLAEANIPTYLKALIGQAQDGIESTIDFITRSDLTPGMKWLALTGVSEHIKTVELALEDKLPRGVLAMALRTSGEIARTLNLLVGSALPADVMRLGLATNSSLFRYVNAVLSSGTNASAMKIALAGASVLNREVKAILQSGSSAEAVALALQSASTRTVNVLARQHPGLNARQRQLLDILSGTTSGLLTLGGRFSFDPSGAFRTWYEGKTETAIATPMDRLRGSLNDLRGEVRAERTDLKSVAKAIAGLGGTDGKARAVDSIMSRADFNKDWEITADGRDWQGLHSISESQLYGLAQAFGVSLKNKNGDLRYSNNVRGDVENRLRELGYITGAERLHRDFSAGTAHWESWLKSSGLPMFALGGNHLGGLRLVGERGPELEATGPSRIWSAEQTRRMLSGGGGGGDAALLAEMRAMHSELAAMRGEQRAAAVKRGADLEAQREILERWEVIGQPGVRA